ncbi:MAG: type I methionyl aminopeptidase [Geminicoccaceae bacterium]
MMQDQMKATDSAARRTQVPIHDAEAFESMRRAGQLAAATLDMIGEHVKPGVTTEALDRLCHEFILAHDAQPAPLGYRGYPKATCISLNEVVCHGIPNSYKLAKRDILNIDVTVILDGWYGDSSRMYFADEPVTQKKKLCEVTFEALWRGIRAVRPGATLGDLGDAIQSYVESEHCSVVRDYCGHGIGRVFHDAPSVVHYGKPGTGMTLEAGMLFTIEPMVNLGTYEVKLNKKDGWTVTTKDGKTSAQFEHTIGVTEDGCEVFTLSPKGLHHPIW